jgi:hypothetical protein
MARSFSAAINQMPEHVPVKKTRARDFYDVYTVVTGIRLDMAAPKYQELVQAVFEAKAVPLWLLGRRDLHRVDQCVYSHAAVPRRQRAGIQPNA